jgi:multimeric flavodoxin WrbA
MKKIVCVLGSPRSGANSESIARKFLETAEALGAEARIYHLNKLNYRGCQGCLACKKISEECVLKDDGAEVLSAIRDADITLMVSPVYFGDVTAQMKGIVDRTYSFLKPTYLTEPNATRLAPGKHCVFVLTQGSGDESQFDVFPKYDGFLSWFGFKTHLIRAVGFGPDPTQAARREDLMTQAENLARQLISEG